LIRHHPRLGFLLDTIRFYLRIAYSPSFLYPFLFQILVSLTPRGGFRFLPHRHRFVVLIRRQRRRRKLRSRFLLKVFIRVRRGMFTLLRLSDLLFQITNLFVKQVFPVEFHIKFTITWSDRFARRLHCIFKGILLENIRAKSRGFLLVKFICAP